MLRIGKIGKMTSRTLLKPSEPTPPIEANGELVDGQEIYESTRFELASGYPILYTKGLPYIAFFGSDDVMIKYVNHNKAGELNQPLQDDIPSNATYVICSWYNKWSTPYARYDSPN